jgi:antitoxin HicB
MPSPSRLDRMANPAGDWSMDDVAALCREHGIRCSRRGRRVALEGVRCRRPVKAFYIRRIVRFVEQVGSERGGPWVTVIIEPLPQNEGGGFVALVPDLPGCMSDGETAEGALASVKDAIAAWIDEARAIGRGLPPPSRHLQAAEW